MPEPLTAEVLASLTTDELLSRSVTVKRQTKHLEELYKLLCDEMTLRVEVGTLDPGGFSHNDVTFAYSEGKRTWDYPKTIKSMEKDVRNAKLRAQADGSAIATYGAPFWTLGLGED
jgi:hypothetical protein